MNYLDSSEYALFGLDEAADDMWIAAASALIDAHCHRDTLAARQYVERFRVARESLCIRLTFLPLLAVAPLTTPLVSARGRYGALRKGESVGYDIARDVALAFALPGAWVSIDTSQMDYDPLTGEITFAPNIFGLSYSELEITYTAGLDPIPDPIKHACAQIVRNAQATPGLNVRAGWLDKMKLQYFAPTLLDDDVRKLLAPYVAQRMHG